MPTGHYERRNSQTPAEVILTLLAQHPWAGSDLVQRLKHRLTRRAVYDLLRTLEAEGQIQQEPRNGGTLWRLARGE